jgi:lipopolysaccharide biosynthesis regulator YciM
MLDGDMTDQERRLRERVHEAPDDAPALRELAELVGRARTRKGEDVDLWRRYLEVAGGELIGEALLALGRAQVEARKEREAVETLRRCTVEWPTCFTAFDLLGELLRLEGEHEAAVEALQRAIELDPSAIRPRLALVSCFDALGRAADAEAALEHVRELDPGDPAILALVQELVQRRG